LGAQSSEAPHKSLEFGKQHIPSHESIGKTIGKTMEKPNIQTLDDHLSAPETLEKPWSLKRCGS
jgi:hypothetical protein